MIIENRIRAAIPDIPDTALQDAVAFAVSSMENARGIYREPVSLIEVQRSGDASLAFSVRALFTHNTSMYHYNYAPDAAELI